MLFAETNGGTSRFDFVGQMKLLPLTCYYNPHTIATILAFHELVDLKDIEVKYNSEKENAFYVINKKEGRVMKFKKCGIGFYFYNESNPNEHKFKMDNVTNKNYCFLNTITNSKQLMSRQEIERADKA